MYSVGERVTIFHASLSSVIRCDRAGNTFADVSKKFSSIIVSVLALIFGLFLVFGILVLREIIFMEDLIGLVNENAELWGK